MVLLSLMSNPTDSLMSLITRHGKQLRFFMMLLLISTVFPMKTTESKCLDRGKVEEFSGELLNELPADQVRAIKRINKESLSAWLTALPIAAENFDFSEVEFRNALSVRYNKNLIASPKFCDGCQSPFTLRHALACKKGGLLTLRQNEIRDAVGDLASLLWKDVQREPVIREYNPQEETPALIADLFCRGVYVRQGGASFDNRVSDTDAISYQNRRPMSVLHSAEVEKKTKYSTRVRKVITLSLLLSCLLMGRLLQNLQVSFGE